MQISTNHGRQVTLDAVTGRMSGRKVICKIQPSPGLKLSPDREVVLFDVPENGECYVGLGAGVGEGGIADLFPLFLRRSS
jgi:hypothetical protein